MAVSGVMVAGPGSSDPEAKRCVLMAPSSTLLWNFCYDDINALNLAVLGHHQGCAVVGYAEISLLKSVVSRAG